MNLFCRLQKLPRTVRAAAAWVLIIAGLPLFLTPFPGGIVMVSAGAMILFCAYPAVRLRISRLLLRGPKITARLAAVLAVCERCKAKRPHPPCQPASSTADVD
mgnify:CR=1 FL=1